MTQWDGARQPYTSNRSQSEMGDGRVERWNRLGPSRDNLTAAPHARDRLALSGSTAQSPSGWTSYCIVSPFRRYRRTMFADIAMLSRPNGAVTTGPRNYITLRYVYESFERQMKQWKRNWLRCVIGTHEFCSVLINHCCTSHCGHLKNVIEKSK